MRPGKPKNFSKRSGEKPAYKSGYGRDKKKSFEKKSFEKKPFEKKAFEKKTLEKKTFEKPAFEKKREREPQLGAQRLTGTLLWGFHAVRAAWLNKNRHIQRLLATDTALAGFTDTIAEGKGVKRPQPEIMEKNGLDRIMPPGSVHQGIVAIVDNLPGRDAHDLIASLPDGAPALILILDQVTDPHNVGAIMRSAAAFGAQGIILQDRHAPELSGVLAKIASGAAEIVPVAAETNLSRAIEMLQENGFFVVGLDERGDAIADLEKHARMALVLGAEGAGLRRLVAEHCDALVCLPTQGPIKSLNVSNAAAVALYAIKAR